VATETTRPGRTSSPASCRRARRWPRLRPGRARSGGRAGGETEKLAQHPLHHRAQRTLGACEALWPHPQQLLEVLLHQPEKRRLPRPPRPVHPASDLHAQPVAGGRGTGTKRRRPSRPSLPTMARVCASGRPAQVRSAGHEKKRLLIHQIRQLMRRSRKVGAGGAPSGLSAFGGALRPLRARERRPAGRGAARGPSRAGRRRRRCRRRGRRGA
jgi:hypothetical protein